MAGPDKGRKRKGAIPSPVTHTTSITHHTEAIMATLYTVEFTVKDDPCTFSFDAPGLVNVILGLEHYEWAIGNEIETVTLIGV